MTYRERLRWLAFDNHGIVTTRQAASANVPAVEVRKLASRGALTHLGYGVYRMEEVPITRRTHYAEALALVGEGAVLANESVLDIHELAHVDPPAVQVASPRRTRVKLPDTVRVVRPRRIEGVEYVDGLPTMPLKDALLACQGRVMRERLLDATREAAERGDLTPRDAEETQLRLSEGIG